MYNFFFRLMMSEDRQAEIDKKEKARLREEEKRKREEEEEFGA